MKESLVEVLKGLLEVRIRQFVPLAANGDRYRLKRVSRDRCPLAGQKVIEHVEYRGLSCAILSDEDHGVILQPKIHILVTVKAGNFESCNGGHRTISFKGLVGGRSASKELRKQRITCSSEFSRRLLVIGFHLPHPTVRECAEVHSNALARDDDAIGIEAVGRCTLAAGLQDSDALRL